MGSGCDGRGGGGGGGGGRGKAREGDDRMKENGRRLVKKGRKGREGRERKGKRNGDMLVVRKGGGKGERRKEGRGRRERRERKGEKVIKSPFSLC